MELVMMYLGIGAMVSEFIIWAVVSREEELTELQRWVYRIIFTVFFPLVIVALFD